MVRTTKGPAEGPRPKKKVAPPKEQTVRHDDIDDATWDHIQAMATSQQTTTGEVIRRAIENQYGVAPAVGAYHSGTKTDPALA